MKRTFKFSLARSSQQVLLGLSLLLVPAHQTLRADEASSAAAPAVQELLVKAGDGLALETLVISPTKESTAPLGVLVMTHGFLLSQTFYRDVLAQVANQGFVVLAPQAYAPGGLPFGKPTTDVEAQKVAKAIEWFETHLSTLINRPVDFEKIGLVSHSRGSKVAWTILRDQLTRVKAVAAIDPVDGTQDGSARVTGGTFQLDLPAFIIGTGLGGVNGSFGQACAPSDMSYNSFWKSAQVANSWLYVAKDYGHMDFLDDGIKCGMMCSVCSKAPAAQSRSDFRAWIAQGVASFMHGILDADQTSLESLGQSSPLINATFEHR